MAILCRHPSQTTDPAEPAIKAKTVITPSRIDSTIIDSST
jgi:hypothetical protein